MKYKHPSSWSVHVVPTDILQKGIREGLSQRALVRKYCDLGFKISRTSLQRRLHVMRSQKCGFQKFDIRSAPKLSERVGRHLERLVRFHDLRSTTSLHKELVKEGHCVSYSTVYRLLKSRRNLCLRRPRQRPFLTVAQMKARQDWARHALAHKIDWNKVMFADEKVWSLDGPVYRSKVWCDKRDPSLILPRKGTISRSVYVWGAFSSNVVPSLVRVSAHINSREYCDVLQKALLPVLPTKRLTLYHDRHTAHHSEVDE